MCEKLQVTGGEAQAEALQGSLAQEGPGEAGWLLWPSRLMTWTLEEDAVLLKGLRRCWVESTALSTHPSHPILSQLLPAIEPQP